jgi:hypothetical protein
MDDFFFLVSFSLCLSTDIIILIIIIIKMKESLTNLTYIVKTSYFPWVVTTNTVKA